MRLDAADVLSIYDSVIPEKSALYCSVPVTSGRRYITWLRTAGGSDSLTNASPAHLESYQAHVLRPNMAAANRVVARLRSAYQLAVINPARFPSIPQWDQDRWIQFWERVIERFAIAIVFAEDWQFSYGCAHEFLFAQRSGLAAFSEDGRYLSLAAGRSMVESVVKSLDETSQVSDRLSLALRLFPKSDVRVPKTVSSISEFVSEHAQCITKTKY